MDRGRLAVVLGAGANNLCGIPSTEGLTNAVTMLGSLISSDVRYRLASDRLPTDQWKPDQEVWSVTQILWEALRGAYEAPTFETYIHALETLEPLALTRRNPNVFGYLDGFKPVVAAFSDILTRFDPLIRAGVLRAERLDVTRRIFEALDTSPARVQHNPNTVAARVAFARTFNAINEAFQTTVLSLNYDDLLEVVGGPVFDGFTTPIKGQPNQRAFSAAEFVEVAGSLPGNTVLHLHGSTRFGYGELGESFIPPIVKFETRDQAAASVIAAIASFDAARGDVADGGVMRSVSPIISGVQKADKLMLTPIPYGYYYQRAVSTLLRSKRLLVIGYGCKDPHINAWIHEAARIHGDDYKIAFVTYVAPDWRGPITSPGIAAIGGFLSAAGQDAAQRWNGWGADVIAVGRALVVRSGMPLSDEHIGQVVEFLST
jgi:hypothetical protein